MSSSEVSLLQIYIKHELSISLGSIQHSRSHYPCISFAKLGTPLWIPSPQNAETLSPRFMLWVPKMGTLELPNLTHYFRSSPLYVSRNQVEIFIFSSFCHLHGNAIYMVRLLQITLPYIYFLSYY